MGKIKALLVITLLILSLRVEAIQNIQIEANSSLGLNDCIKIALNNSPIIKKSILNYDIASSNIGVAKSALSRAFFGSRLQSNFWREESQFRKLSDKNSAFV